MWRKTELGMLCPFHITLMLVLQYCWFIGPTDSCYHLHTQSHWRAIIPAFQKCNRFWLHTECHPSTGMPLAGHHSAANSHWMLPGMDSKLPTKNKLMNAIMTTKGQSHDTKVAIKKLHSLSQARDEGVSPFHVIYSPPFNLSIAHQMETNTSCRGPQQEPLHLNHSNLSKDQRTYLEHGSDVFHMCCWSECCLNLADSFNQSFCCLSHLFHFLIVQ